ncbi:hypothetical protein GCM10020219_091180 [Nonomuraea dietziae]
MFAVANSALINMMMASRLVYGLANERVVPKALGMVDPRRRTPVVGILFTTALAIGLISSTEIAGLGETHRLPAAVRLRRGQHRGCSCLRREEVDHAHYRAPTALPAIGAVMALVLASPLTGRPGNVYVIAGVLLGIGVLLWLVNWAFTRRQRHEEETV